MVAHLLVLNDRAFWQKPISAGCAAFFNSAHTQHLTVTQEPDTEVVKRAELQKLGLRVEKLILDGETILAYDLVEKHYGVDMRRVVSVAPMLFTLLAEMGLAERRRRLKEAEAALENFPNHLIARHWSALDAERASIGQRDIFTRLIDEHEVDASYYNEEERNPFSDFLARLVEELGSENEAIDPEEIHFDPETVFDHVPLFESYRKNLTGGSGRADYALSHGYVRIGQIPKELRGEDEDVTSERVKWLESEVPTEDWEDSLPFMLL